MSEKYVVDGFCFKSEEEANTARNEIEGIEYLRKRTNMRNPASVMAIYNRVIEKELFKTPIGYNFLRELQEILYETPEIDNSKVRGIPVAGKNTKGKGRSEAKAKKATLLPDEQERKYKNKITNLIILNIFIIAVLIVVIIITNNSDNTNILNYRERLEREYSEKENELAVWDKQLREREKELERIENEGE